MVPTTIIDLSPKSLADALDALVSATLESDREVASVLTVCREGLRALAWNRYADHHMHLSRRNSFIRRHKGV